MPAPAAAKTVVLPRTLVSKAVSETVYGRTAEGQLAPKDNRQTINDTLLAIRNRNSMVETLRALDARNGTFSSAVFSFVEVAMSGYRVKAFNTQTGQFDYAGSLLASQLIASFDTLFDYTRGFGAKLTFDTLLEQSLLETLFTAGLCHELVLDKQRLPDTINIFPYETIDWKNKGGRKVPEQRRTQGDPVELDLPTIFITELHKQGSRAYADSMLAAGVNPAVSYNEFVEEMRRAVRRQGHSRLTITISVEQVMAALTQETKDDPAKLQAALDAVKNKIESELKSINPEDCLVMYDSVEADLIRSDGEKSDYVPLIEMMSGQLATSLKTNPSMLGLRMQGSQSLSNTESLIFLKIARSLHRPCEANLSRALTLMARLFGQDVFVKLLFNPINLRPQDELEAFSTMRTARIYELLSEGFISDEEAAWELDTGPRAPGAPKLSGTGFHRGRGAAAASNAANVSPNADPQGRALQPDTPAKGGGKSQ